MRNKTAIKRLTASDLTIFKWHYENNPAGNQKAINLNRNVFIDDLYPELIEIAEDTSGRIPLDIFLYGPGLSREHNLARKIIKGGSYKNWRLDGEYIENPPEEPSRYNHLNPGDFLIIDFIGAGKPESARLFFISSSIEEDQNLHSKISDFLGNAKMQQIDRIDLEEMIVSADVDEDHPSKLLILDEIIEDISLGGYESIRRANRTLPFLGSISKEQLESARKSQSRAGLLGEELINDYFLTLQDNGEINSFEWVSREKTVSPYDFSYFNLSGEEVYVDVKSTKYSFSQKIHVSYNELLQMLTANTYEIFRVFRLTEEGGNLRRVVIDKQIVEEITQKLGELPLGITCDSISLNPEILSFGEEIRLTFIEEE